MNARLAAVAALEQRIGHVFRDREVLEHALTHASVGGGARVTKHNERLEFLGDRVLGLVVAEWLMEIRPEASEGELTKLMSQLVNYHACAAVARAVGLRDALRLDASATKVGARDNDKVLGDACEALIAALYHDAGFDAARAFVRAFWDEPGATLESPEKDPKTLLQEWALGRGLPVPHYAVVAQSGPAHQPLFTIEARLPGLEPRQASAGSKREAEKLAAAAMLTHCENRP